MGVGVAVYGYDKTETALTKLLAKEGINIHYQDDVALIPEGIDLVIYTPAIPKNQSQLNYFFDNDFTVLKRSEALGAITKDKHTIAVAGSHGKTTVSSMISHILTHSGVGCTAFLGGIAVNYNSNFISGNENLMVVEADEYDRSFLRLHPNLAVITAVDTDHLDIYGSKANIEEAFLQFSNQVSDTLLAHEEVLILDAVSGCEVLSYGEQSNNDIALSNLTVADGSYSFEVSDCGNTNSYALKMGGRHNVLNATAAVAACKRQGVSDDAIAKALASFAGIKRRFELVYKSDDVVYIDDYAHHPKEIEALLNSVKELYPGKKITAIFQPHLFSRTQDLAAGFAEALDMADSVLLMPIYPAREEPIAGVTSQLIADAMRESTVEIVEAKNILGNLKTKNTEVILTIGAGDIDRQVDAIESWLTNRENATV